MLRQVTIVHAAAMTQYRRASRVARYDVTAVTRVGVAVSGVRGRSASGAAPWRRRRWAMELVVGDLAQVAETFDALRKVQCRKHAETRPSSRMRLLLAQINHAST